MHFKTLRFRLIKTHRFLWVHASRFIAFLTYLAVNLCMLDRTQYQAPHIHMSVRHICFEFKTGCVKKRLHDTMTSLFSKALFLSVVSTFDRVSDPFFHLITPPFLSILLQTEGQNALKSIRFQTSTHKCKRVLK